MNLINRFYERNYICPICEMKFSSLAIRSSAIYVEKRESDFHNIYRGLNPLHYSIIVCPKCNYAASKQTFAKVLPSSKVVQIRQAFANLDIKDTNFLKERDSSIALESLQLAIRSALLKKTSSGEVAGLFQAAAWICREDQDVELEKTYLEQARKYYQQGYEESSSNVGNLTDVQVSYLIGDLSLRLGQYNEAIKWFNLTISNPKLKLNRNLENQTRDQWSLARELGKNQSADPEPTPPRAEVARAKAKPVHAGETKPDVHRYRPSMQMKSTLYSDQIDWFNQVTNRGYDLSKKMVNREQVLRSLVDACMEYLNGKVPDNFSSEAELRSRWLELLQE